MNEQELRERMAMHGASLFQRGYSCGGSGNISAKLDDGILISPTSSCLGRLDPGRISKVSFAGEHLAGDKPSKEIYLHVMMYEQRPDAGAVVHLHSPYSVAVSCLEGVDPGNVIPPITPYFVMRIGKLPLVAYFRPGDPAMAEAARGPAKDHVAVLLANHGPVVSGASLDAAVYAAEELEAAAKLYLMLRGMKIRLLNGQQVEALKRPLSK